MHTFSPSKADWTKERTSLKICDWEIEGGKTQSKWNNLAVAYSTSSRDWGNSLFGGVGSVMQFWFVQDFLNSKESLHEFCRGFILQKTLMLPLSICTWLWRCFLNISVFCKSSIKHLNDTSISSIRLLSAYISSSFLYSSPWRPSTFSSWSRTGIMASISCCRSLCSSLIFDIRCDWCSLSSASEMLSGSYWSTMLSGFEAQSTTGVSCLRSEPEASRGLGKEPRWNSGLRTSS